MPESEPESESEKLAFLFFPLGSGVDEYSPGVGEPLFAVFNLAALVPAATLISFSLFRFELDDAGMLLAGFTFRFFGAGGDFEPVYESESKPESESEFEEIVCSLSFPLSLKGIRGGLPVLPVGGSV